MRFPSLLKKKNRPRVSQKYFLNRHNVYVRHKPGHDYNLELDLPDYTKIKLWDNQSCNWDKLSLPYWVRFNDKKEYLNNYAVLSYNVGGIRLPRTIGVEGIDNVIFLSHEPIENNYSHCELNSTRSLNRSERRELRLKIKHKSIVHLKPNEVPKNSLISYLRLLLNNIKYSILGYFA